MLMISAFGTATPVHDLAFPGGFSRHAPANLRVGDELGELVPHVARAQDAVVLRHQVRRAHEQVHERQLVAHGGEAVELHESLGQWPRHVHLAVQEHALPGDFYVIEYGERLHHLVFGRNRVFELRSFSAAVAAGQHGEAGRIGRHGAGHGVRLIAFSHVSRGQHDNLVRVGGNGSVHLGPAQGDALVVLGHHADVIIGVRLIARAFAPVSFHVRLRDGDGEVALPAVLVEFPDAREVVRA